MNSFIPNFRRLRSLVGISLGIAIVANESARSDTIHEQTFPLKIRKILTADVGAAQGIVSHMGKFYIFGDKCHSSGDHIGIIREFDSNLTPTGRCVRLRTNKGAVIQHPTGVTFANGSVAYIGDTVQGTGRIFQVDWDKLWRDGDLRNGILAVISDDAAVSGSRPELVKQGRKQYLASADYAPEPAAAIRFYDIPAMLQLRRTKHAKVQVFRFPSGGYNQSLAWDKFTKRLLCIRNDSPGVGWKLSIMKICDDQSHRIGINTEAIVRFEQRSELEGCVRVDHNTTIFVTSNERNNVIVADTSEIFAPFDHAR